MPKPRTKLDKLDALAQGDPLKILALMLWKNRLREPDLFMQIEEKDIDGFEDCVRYLKVIPEVLIERPAGLPAQPAIPATHHRRAVPARPATPPKPFVIVTLTDAQTGDCFRPIENNEHDYDRSLEMAKIKRIREQAPQMASRLVEQVNKGELSLSDAQDAAEALLLLSRA
jgi:hypothetical protein